MSNRAPRFARRGGSLQTQIWARQRAS